MRRKAMGGHSPRDWTGVGNSRPADRHMGEGANFPAPRPIPSMSETTKDLERVVDAVLACTGPVTQILDHMARSPQPLAPERAAEVLRGLLCGALHPLTVDAPREELRVAARLLDAAADLIVGEIMLVPHAPRRPAQVRPRRGCPGR